MRLIGHNFENSPEYIIYASLPKKSHTSAGSIIQPPRIDSSTQEACPSSLNLIGQGLSCWLTDWRVRDGHTDSAHTEADAN